MGFARLAVSSVWIIVCIAAVGYPPWLVLGRRRWPHWGPAGCLVLGLAVLQVLSWLWLTVTRGGLGQFSAVIVGAAFVADAVLLFSRRREIRWRLSIFGIGVVIATAGTLLVAVIHFAPLANQHSYTIPAGGNNDVGQYVEVTEHLVRNGMYDPGNLQGGDFGSLVRDGVPGGYFYVATSAQVLSVAVWKSTSAALISVYMISAIVLFTVLASFIRRSFLLLALVAVAAMAPFLVVYSVTQYFLAQFIAMAVFPIAVCVMHECTLSMSRASRARLLALLGATATVLLLTYQQWYLAGLPLALVVALAYRLITSDWSSRASAVRVSRAAASATIIWIRNAAIAGVIAAVGAALIVPNRAVPAIRRALDLESGTFGWPLGEITPSEMLGFQRMFDLDTPTTKVLASGALCALFAVVAALLWKRGQRAGPALIVAAGLLYGSYFLVYLRYGYSYNQWKWLGFLTPTIVALLIAPVVLAIDEPFRKAVPRVRKPKVGMGTAIAAVGLVALIGIQTANAKTFTRWMDGRSPGVSRAMASLGDDPRVQRFKTLNISISPVNANPTWETAWLGAFLSDAQHLYGLNANYLPTSHPCADWTLVRRDDPDLAHAHLQERVNLNRVYALARFQSLQGEHFEGTITLPNDADSGPVQVLLSSGTDTDPNVIAVEYLDGQMMRFSFRRGNDVRAQGSKVVRVPGSTHQIQIEMSRTGNVNVTVDGDPVLDAPAELSPAFGRGTLVGSSGDTTTMASFSGALALTSLDARTCSAERGSR